ncbi:hypothetical protein J2736_004235 [Paenibacillus qinlingensis]|uniref:Uncharacterized protein n=1 Tax=Paenibacillus qinlingensis TaxID=1837343 RepID=A0ABU1NZY4_9BACL|nr:hypothetical protein [Paenibacillus qinlingensis]
MDADDSRVGEQSDVSLEAVTWEAVSKWRDLLGSSFLYVEEELV